MKSIMLQPSPQLKGEEAIAALNSFMKELMTREKNFTKKQTKTLKKFAKGLISAIKAEQSRT